jgi:cell division cycle 20-like protein 1 (cofactor of APC complex)
VVYLFSFGDAKVTKLFKYDQNKVTNVTWSNSGDKLVVGTDSGLVQIWDAERQKVEREFQGHEGRVCTASWRGTGLLSTGGKDKKILHMDPRVNSEFVSRSIGHKQEICGLKWSPDETQLASGGNDNKLMLWNAKSSL